jgi:hypothetical protein
MKRKIIYLIPLAVLVFISCGVKTVKEETIQLKSINTIDKTKLDELSRIKIFFGHKSVGQNILDGMKELAPIQINRIKNPEDRIKQGINHTYIGENSNPISKINDFKRYMDNGLGDNVDIAFFKLCYVDIDSNTDIQSLFKKYKDTMDYLKISYPDTTFFHVTTPLVAEQKGSIKSTVKRFFRMPIWGIHDNIKREEYNNILRDEYAGTELVFDLAYFESIELDGKRITYTFDGSKYYTLASSITNDGGHLNEAGKKFIAEQFLIFLATH